VDIESKEAFFALPVRHTRASEDIFQGRLHFCTVDARQPTECEFFTVVKERRPGRPVCPTHQRQSMGWGDLYETPGGEQYRFHI
jgi:hypothetical protein